MTYPLLEQAPEDHNSPEFLTFLRENNVVVAVLDYWLVIENCKYHTKEKPHLTAFYIDEGFPLPSHLKGLQKAFYQHDMLIKALPRQSVQRFHIHLLTPEDK